MNLAYKLLLYYFISIITFLLFSCNDLKQPTATNFYHWKTHLQLSKIEKEQLIVLKTQKLYTKFFDVDWDGQNAIPKALVQLDSGLVTLQNLNIAIIPTIFITNRTLQNCSLNDIPDLSNKIVDKIFQITQKYHLSIEEIQIDCDWSLSTKERYFRLLNEIKSHKTNLKLSATIRLHQIKFPEETGIPPVDEGVLMYYNMGNVGHWETENSIIDAKLGQQYINRLDDYALPLNLALPLFQWGVLFRDGRMIRLINDLRLEELADTSRFQKIDHQRFQVLKSTYLHGHYLYRKDKIRLEITRAEDLAEAKEMLFPKMNQDAFELIFYHLDEQNLSKFQLEREE